MRLCSIASGSSGNCIYVGSEATHLLVDVGISGKKAEAGLNSLGLTGRDLDGILVTHEHMDHVAGLGVMARKYDVPIYATPGTLEEIQKMGNLGKIDPELFREVKEDVKLTIKDLTVNPMFSISSASSITTFWMVVRDTVLRSIRSSKRPGVATMICTPCFRARIWLSMDEPPYTGNTLNPVMYLE